MAKQFEATIGGTSILFPSSQVRMFDNSGIASIDYGGVTNNAEETLEDLVALCNDGGTEQVQVSVLRVNQGVQTNPISMSFPASSLNIYPSSVSGSNAVIIFLGSKYYVSETPSEIETAANAGGGGGSSYLVWDAAYQNSAMSSPVGAYLYKDADGVIWKVYEPTRNNVVSRSVFSYADSIDKIPFDNVNWEDNKLVDVKFLGFTLPNLSIVKGCVLETMVAGFSGIGSSPILITSVNQGAKQFTLDASLGDLRQYFTTSFNRYTIPFIINGSTGNDGTYTTTNATWDSTNTIITVSESIPSAVANGGITGLTMIDHKQKGTLGIDQLNRYPNHSELYVTGDNFRAFQNEVGVNTYFDSIGNLCLIKNSAFASVDIDFLGSNKCIIEESHFLLWSGCEFNDDGGRISLCQLDVDAYIDVYAVLVNNVKAGPISYINAVQSISNTSIGVLGDIDTTNGSIVGCTIGDNITFSPSIAFVDANIQNIGGTAYELGVAAGAVTATAV